MAYALVLFLACWQVMTIVMMLPSSMPLVYMMVHASRRQRYPWATQAAFLAGYAVVWTAFALAAFLADTLVHRLVSNWFWLYIHSWLIGAVIFAIAGGFQFSPLKEHCLRQCRSPLSFFMRYYRQGIGAAWHLGLRHGMFCLGCCWALMLVMFGVGVGSIVWMALLLLMVLWLVHPCIGYLGHLFKKMAAWAFTARFFFVVRWHSAIAFVGGMVLMDQRK